MKFKVSLISIILSCSVAFSKTEQISKCSFPKIDVLQLTCNDNSNSITNHILDDSPVIQCDSARMPKNEIKEIRFNNCKVNSIKNTYFEAYPNVESFIVESSDLKMIESDNFKNAINLNEIKIRFNGLTELRSFLFRFAPKISSVDFSHGTIARIDPFAFYNATQLSYLDLSHNKIDVLDKRIFTELPEIRTILLNNNIIQVIEPALFTSLKNLKKLHLNVNSIDEFDCQILSSLSNLTELDLSSDRLESFDTSCRSDGKMFKLYIQKNKLRKLTLADNVEYVDAADNQLSRIIVNVDLTHLKYLDLSSNAIENIHEVLEKLTATLTYLNLAGNPMKKVEVNTFSKLVKLQTLNLKATNISTIQFGSFGHLTNLKKIDLSNNDLIPKYSDEALLRDFRFDKNYFTISIKSQFKQLRAANNQIESSFNHFGQLLRNVTGKLESFDQNNNEFVPKITTERSIISKAVDVDSNEDEHIIAAKLGTPFIFSGKNSSPTVPQIIFYFIASIMYILIVVRLFVLICRSNNEQFIQVAQNLLPENGLQEVQTMIESNL